MVNQALPHAFPRASRAEIKTTYFF